MSSQDIDYKENLSSTRLIDDLRRRIVNGELLPSERLRQREIAAHYDVSGMTARDAVKILLEEGFATQEGAKTFTVSPRSPIDFLEIMELRQLLEPRALELSGPRLEKQTFSDLRTLLGGNNSNWSAEETADRHWAFHKLLYSRAGRPRTFDILDRLNSHIVRYMLPLWSSIGIGEDWRSHHLRLVELVERDKIDDAIEELKADLVKTKARVLEHMVPD